MPETRRLNKNRVCPDCKTSMNPYVLEDNLPIENTRPSIYVPPGGLVFSDDEELSCMHLECATCSCHWFEAYAKDSA